jgi:hypothetical protein
VGGKGGSGGRGEKLTQALYAHMNNKTIKKKNVDIQFFFLALLGLNKEPCT